MDSRIDRARIGDLLEIQRLKGLYFYNLDHKQWAEWAALFTTDARLLAGNVLSEGIDNILKYVIGKLATPKSVHHGHTPLIEFDGDDAARGIWAMADIIDLGKDGILYGYGHYREEYRRDAGVWKFSYVHLTRLREEILPARTASA